MAIEANFNDNGLTAASPFFNDFDETKKYVQMLFTPGRALQARELTQLQTMLQTQVDRFGSHIFENGSPVGGGLTTVHTDISYVRIDPDASYTNITDFSSLIGKTLTDSVSGVKARVSHVDTDVTDDDPYPVLFIHYTAASPDGLTTRFTNESTLSSAAVSILSSSSSSGGSQVQVITSEQETALGAGADAEGAAYLVSINQGIFFIDGFFMVVDAQSTAPYILSSSNVRIYSSLPTSRIGLTTTKTVVDIGADASLGDPANGSANFAAPGAQRLKIEGVLSQQDYNPSMSSIANSSATDFIELLRIDRGVINKQIKYPIYSDLGETLARRTYDESGNYTVKAFRANARESLHRRVLSIPVLDTGTDFSIGEYVEASTGDTPAIGQVVTWNSSAQELTVDLIQTDEFVTGDHLTGLVSGTAGECAGVSTEHIDIVLDPGKAYIFGNEVETIAPSVVTLDKARDFNSASASTTDGAYGNYFICDTLEGVFDINEQEEIQLQTVASSVVGTAKVKHMLFDSINSYYRVYVYDVQIESGENLGTVERLVGLTNGGVVHIDDTNGKVGGATKLYEKAQNVSVYRMPSNPIQGNLSSPIYYYRLYQSGGIVSGGSVTFAMPTENSGDLYYPAAGGSTTSNLRQNYILVNDTTGVDISSSITQGNRSGSNLTLSGLGTYNGNSVSVISVVQSTTMTRTKTAVESYTIPADLYLESSTILNLGIADVTNVVSVVDIGDGGADVTSKFILDDGQRDNIYDHARLKLAPGQTVNGSSGFSVVIDYFEHSGVGPLTFNSYADMGFDDFPVYSSPNTGRTYPLRDCVDFRPIKDSQFSGTASSSSAPTSIDYAKVICPYDSLYRTFTASHNFYNARIDKIILRENREFDVLKGIPSLTPIPPDDDPKAMTLYNIEMPPFTGIVSDIILEYVDNRRYTMRDIGKLRQRISNVEYYASLSLLEQQADTITVRDSNGAERFKNGILVDSFNGHQIGDVYSRDYRCSMDFEAGNLRPPFISENVSLEYDSGSSSGTLRKGDQITLTPTSTTEPFVAQVLASRCLSVNPFNITSWLGDMTLSPESDVWFDSTTRPNVQVNYEGSADAWQYINNSGSTTGFSTEWGDWETYWSGSITESSSQTTTGGVHSMYHRETASGSSTQEIQTRQTRSGIKTYYDVATSEETLGERVVNVKVIPYMRAVTVTATAKGMKPNTIIYPFFGDTPVSQYCTPSAIQTNSAGEAIITFNIPAGVFETGTKTFRVTDDPNDDYLLTTTAAEALFTARGMLEEKQKDIISTKTAVIRRESVDDSRILRGPKTTSYSNSTKSNGQSGRRTAVQTGSSTIETFSKGWADPLAQSFLVDAAVNPNGVMLSSVDLFFRTKDDDLPVTVDLRPSVNGYPSSTTIIPFSTVTKTPNEVNTSDSPNPSSSSSYTRFEFPSFVYLPPGEYHVTVRSNSDAYCAFIAEIGQNQIGSGERITEQPYAGVLFKSQNASTWTADQYSDLTFRLNRCLFNANTSASAIFDSVGGGSNRHADLIQIMSSDLSFQAAPITYEYETTEDGGSPSGSFLPCSTNIDLLQPTTKQVDNASDLKLKSNMITYDTAISPILDEERIAAIVVENVINDSTIGETAPQADLVNGAMARYITRRVTLQSGAEATDLRVYIAASLPEVANIYVYHKVLAAEDDTPWDDRPWTLMSEVNGLGKQRALNEFLEYEFRTTEFDEDGDLTAKYGDYDDFQTYAVKIVMTSPNSAQVPIISDLRTIAVL